MTRHDLSFCFILLPLLTACTTNPPQTQPYSREADQAKTLMAHGQPKQAARLYQNLAESQTTWQNQYRLMAAGALIQSGDTDNAKKNADSIDSARLSERQRQQLNLIYAQISLNYGNAEQALGRLQAIQFTKLNKEERQSYYRSLAFATALAGKLLDSAIARIQLNSLLSDPLQIRENNSAVLETLSLLPQQTLHAKSRFASEPLDGWLQLASLLKQQRANSAELKAAIGQWRQHFPLHPANGDFLQTYLHPQRPFSQPSAIAVLLPESGPYATAAKAIREGIMAAYHQQYAANPPSLRFYDSTLNAPVTLYDQAVANGAELIVGPLSKENIEALIAGSDLPVPVLALNHVEGLSRLNLYQYALSPLDDAGQITEKAIQDGHHKAVFLTPENDQGERTARYLNEAWLQAGGEVLENQFYNPKHHDFSDPIKKLLNLNESEHRYQELRQLLGRNLHFTPRRRHDVDAIFMNAYPTSARSLNPQLRFYHAADVPVYATPNLYSGEANPTRDIDLNNISFCDIPWFFSDYYQGELSQTALQSNWEKFPDSYLRLIAMGIDAYNLISQLDKLGTTQFPGATGNLSLNQENRITRQLVCAKFHNGRPIATGFIDDPMTENYRSIAISTPPPKAVGETHVTDVE